MVTSFQTGLGNIESLCWCYQEKDKCKFHTITSTIRYRYLRRYWVFHKVPVAIPNAYYSNTTYFELGQKLPGHVCISCTNGLTH